MPTQSLARELVQAVRNVVVGRVQGLGARPTAARTAAMHPELPLATSGGVFQNKMLVELLAERVGNRSAGWLRPKSIPPGDGGLAAGQLAIAAARAAMRNRQVSPCV